MCFSATASFTAGAVLTVIGIATLKKAHHKSQFLFACIPLIFGVQQFAEGVLWVALPNPDLWKTQQIATMIYLIFAQIVWPIWVPIAILQLGKSKTRKTIQRIFVIAGLLVGAYLTYYLIAFQGEAQIKGHHIAYQQNYPSALKPFIILFYGMATIAPHFFSHIKKMWILGVSILISYFVTVQFYEHHVLSVWCFFSSLISIFIYIIMVEIEKTRKETTSKTYRDVRHGEI